MRTSRSTRGAVRAMSIAGDFVFVCDDLQVMMLRSDDLSVVERWVGRSDDSPLSLASGSVPLIDDSGDHVGTGLLCVSGHQRGNVALRHACSQHDDDDDDGTVKLLRTRSAVRAVSLSHSVLAAGGEDGAVRLFGIAFLRNGSSTLSICSQLLCRLPSAGGEVECLALSPSKEGNYLAIGRSGGGSGGACGAEGGGLALWSFECEEPLPEVWALSDEDDTDDDDDGGDDGGDGGHGGGGDIIGRRGCARRVHFVPCPLPERSSPGTATAIATISSAGVNESTNASSPHVLGDGVYAVAMLNEPPSNELPSNEPPSNELPSNEPPSNEPPSNEPPSNEPPSNELPSTAEGAGAEEEEVEGAGAGGGSADGSVWMVAGGANGRVGLWRLSPSPRTKLSARY